jgi:hypothetical protein
MAPLRTACLCAVLAAGCDGGASDDVARSAAPGAEPAAAGAAADWPDDPAAAIAVRRERRHDLTGDGSAERIVVEARGPRYDTLEITLAITTARGDTLWLERWPSEYYFHDDAAADRSDPAVARTVRGHVDALLAPEKLQTGLPAGVVGGDPTALIEESVRYHLAELDWRRRVDLQPADPLPAEAHRRIDPGQVSPERTRAVAGEVGAGPTFTYYAGGEATYVIGWSVREHALIRLFACC